MICRNCKKELGTYIICDNCYTLVDFVEYEQWVTKRLPTLKIPTKKRRIKKGEIVCSKCRCGVKVGKFQCGVCGNIVSEKLAMQAAKETYALIRDEQTKKEIIKKNKGLQILCWIIPFLGLFLWLIYRKKRPLFAEVCRKAWAWSSIRIQAIIVILIIILIKTIFK